MRKMIPSTIDGAPSDCAEEPPSASDGATQAPYLAAAATAPSRWVQMAFVALSLVGVALAIELTRVHVFAHTDPSYHSVCAVSEGVNCETVAVSPYSVFAGLPVSVWGILGYLLMGTLGLWACSRKRLHAAWPWGLLLLLTTISVAVSASLAFISATRINSLCLFCMASYVVNLGLLGVTLVGRAHTHRRLVDLVRSDVKALVVRPLIPAVLAVLGAATLGALHAFIPSYWQTPGWAGLPKLASGRDDVGNHWIGAQTPRVTIVEFSDYECPHCRAAHKSMRLLAAKHPDQIRLIHRQLPLDVACNPTVHRPFHAHACRFAEAAECAALQGRFWEMNDALFSIQDRMKAKDVDPIELAVRLGLNRNDFKRCLESDATAGRVAEDVKAAMARNLRGTPSFVAGDRVYVGRIPEEEVERLLGGTP